MHGPAQKILTIGYQENLSRARAAPRFSRVTTFMRKRLTENGFLMDGARPYGQLFDPGSREFNTASDLKFYLQQLKPDCLVFDATDYVTTDGLIDSGRQLLNYAIQSGINTHILLHDSSRPSVSINVHRAYDNHDRLNDTAMRFYWYRKNTLGGLKRLFGVSGVQTFAGIDNLMIRCVNNYGRLIKKDGPKNHMTRNDRLAKIRPFDLNRVPNRNNSELIFDIRDDVTIDGIIGLLGPASTFRTDMHLLLPAGVALPNIHVHRLNFDALFSYWYHHDPRRFGEAPESIQRFEQPCIKNADLRSCCKCATGRRGCGDDCLKYSVAKGLDARQAIYRGL